MNQQGALVAGGTPDSHPPNRANPGSEANMCFCFRLAEWTMAQRRNTIWICLGRTEVFFFFFRSCIWRKAKTVPYDYYNLFIIENCHQFRCKKNCWSVMADGEVERRVVERGRRRDALLVPHESSSQLGAHRRFEVKASSHAQIKQMRIRFWWWKSMCGFWNSTIWPCDDMKHHFYNIVEFNAVDDRSGSSQDELKTLPLIMIAKMTWVT